MEITTKKQLAVILSKLKGFEEPKVRLEQYETDAEIAAEIVWNAFYRGEIEGKVVADLGCGAGILGLSALLMGAKKVFFVDIDEKSIEFAAKNLGFLEVETGMKITDNAVFVVSDIKSFDDKVDVVLENPPFGIKGKKHADRMFLEKAMDIADIVYSFHKAESKGFITKFSDDKGWKIDGYWEFEWLLKKTMDFHEKKVQRVKVGCWRLERV